LYPVWVENGKENNEFPGQPFFFMYEDVCVCLKKEGLREMKKKESGAAREG
jgi:hypothetical protein